MTFDRNKLYSNPVPYQIDPLEASPVFKPFLMECVYAPKNKLFDVMWIFCKDHDDFLRVMECWNRSSEKNMNGKHVFEEYIPSKVEV